VSDVGVAIHLLRAGLRGAGVSVEANLAGTSDASYCDSIAEECRRLIEEGERAADEADRLWRAT
jgi:formiminotetrahydrofolate cyclodeaminase